MPKFPVKSRNSESNDSRNNLETNVTSAAAPNKAEKKSGLSDINNKKARINGKNEGDTSKSDEQPWKCIKCSCPGNLTPVKRISSTGKRDICNRCYIRDRTEKEKRLKGSARPNFSKLKSIDPGSNQPKQQQQMLNYQPFYWSVNPYHQMMTNDERARVPPTRPSPQQPTMIYDGHYFYPTSPGQFEVQMPKSPRMFKSKKSPNNTLNNEPRPFYLSPLPASLSPNQVTIAYPMSQSNLTPGDSTFLPFNFLNSRTASPESSPTTSNLNVPGHRSRNEKASATAGSFQQSM